MSEASPRVTRVLFLDDDQDLRDIVVELLRQFGVVCEAVASLAALQSLIAATSTPHQLAILDINLGPGQPTGVDAYHWLRQHGFAGRIAFLTGHARSHPLVAEATRLGGAIVHDKPITVVDLQAMLG